jgi:dienelactone hydrolase
MFLFITPVFALNVEFQELVIKSFDDLNIKVNFKQAENKERPLFIFINDNLEKKEKWNKLADLLINKNFSVLEYDLREFVNFERKNRRLDNNDYEYRPSYFLRDLDRILLFLDINYEIKNTQIVLIGAGLGANIALKYSTGNKAIKSVILIAPKKDENRVATKASIRNYGERPIMFLTSLNDKESYDTCLDYMASLSKNKNVRLKLYYIDQKPMDFIQEKIVIDDLMDWIHQLKG